MGETTCLVHGFSYASATPNESKQGNAIHVLGESISFGKFKNELLEWDRWSTCTHKKYVEEAVRYSQPGSVAQKKAFFEAHYKKIAAQKAAALLEQENAAKREAEKDGLYPNGEERALLNNSALDDDAKIEEDGVINCDQQNSIGVKGTRKYGGNVAITRHDSPVKNHNAVSVSEDSGTPLVEKPLLKRNYVIEDIASVTSKKISTLSSLKASIQRKTWTISSTPAKPITPLLKKESVIERARKSSVDSMEKKRFSPKSLRALMSSIHTQKHDREKIPASRKTGTSVIDRISSPAPKACTTPLRTPLVAASKGISKHPAATPQSENRRMRTPCDSSSAHRSKTSGPKCSKSLNGYGKKLQSPTPSTPFILRTEERAVKRKQKLEEKFDANDAQRVQTPQRTLKEKAGNEFRKLSHGFCFKARPLPDFYNKQREAHKIPMTKDVAAVQSQLAVLTRSSSIKRQDTISMPHPMTISKSGTSKNLSSKNNVKNFSKLLPTALPKRITYENTSPNIQLQCHGQNYRC